MKSFTFIFFVALIPSVLSINGFPAICTWDPPISVEAGASLSARIDNPWGGRCTATLRLTDSEFLPINWSFEAIQCTDFELAQLSVPVDLPNGDAYIIWQCAGQAALTCSHVEIKNGRGNIGAVSLDQSGTVGCVSSTRQTLTTLITRTNPAGVQVETSLSTLTTVTTSFRTATADPAVAGAPTLTAAVLTDTVLAATGAATTPTLDAPPTPPGTTGSQNADTGLPTTTGNTPTAAGNGITSITPLAGATTATIMPPNPPTNSNERPDTTLAGTMQTARALTSPLLTSTATLTITNCMVPCANTVVPV
ncbi:hypothetical protein BDP55DRAFT_734656 [Colletotrichum godetiae]|uniref:Uncharacterized protein n=1 Tax=Colletotrichum godetiae TaxID=1209918 RepID=A0AAJ0A8A6_9PEZI|nr:uncharacterized protein BDP55DRAFT_734656 [Colletotrichum godetiae]KAK1657728.1 hypothetical protein BDP55DRAFT_734656 [Colletotrichum godetiae]